MWVKNKFEMTEILLRNITYEDAKQEIKKYLEFTHGEVFISDIIMELRIDLETVLKVLDEMEGKNEN